MAANTPAMSINGSTTEKTGLRRTLRRWKDKWRIPSSASSRKSIISAPTTRPPTNRSSIAPPPSHLPTVTASPALPPTPAALFTPTIETFIHSPADPRMRSNSRSHSNSNSSSPAGTLKKPRLVSRRNTVSAEYLSSAAHAYLPNDPTMTPLNVVTTTIVAGNDNVKRKRQSRLRLSLPRGVSMFSAPSSPSQPNFFGHERTASRAGSRTGWRCETVEEKRQEGVGRKRADSDRETLVEEDEVVRRDRVKGVCEAQDTIRVDEVST